MVFQILIKELITMKKKLGLKIVLATLSALILAALVVLFFYLPRYLTKDVTVTPGENAGEELTIMSTNVRFYNPMDFLQKSWFYRAELIAADIAAVCPDILCLQEVTPLHYDYLKDIMPDYNSLITYRDEFILSEGCPIFWRADRFEKISSGSFWLSETPEKISKMEGTAYTRVMTYAVFERKSDKKKFLHVNTHVDYNQSVNEAQVKVILNEVKKLGFGLPTYYTGDFNMFSTHEGYKRMVEDNDDARLVAKEMIEPENLPYIIDFCFVSRNDFDVNKYEMAAKPGSDHYPVYLDIELKD